jgi:hypothetical protein
MTKPTEAWFIEREIAPGVWSRYAGAFDDYERAKRYNDTVGHPTYRITEYRPFHRHDTRISDSSLYDEVCKKCGATTNLDGECPR